ncbi:hypothetical protein HPB51_024517 [Rhipicephalus microplus]|uniref:Cuticle protein n=1 Tax=Rhipicephalus microplus TaxID=6941 RepID=A0A9J6EDG0_RHIMP|nr:hypothetical protein HPB51_024517 [Rhipicephalus microplus]
MPADHGSIAKRPEAQKVFETWWDRVKASTEKKKVTCASFESSEPPQPYSFGYDNVDEFGTQSYHKERSDANNVKTGTYGYRDANGIFRRVSYVADANGFRATVDTNEPGTAPGSSADVVFNARPVRVPVAAKSASAPVPAYAASGAFGRAPWFR